MIILVEEWNYHDCNMAKRNLEQLILSSQDSVAKILTSLSQTIGVKSAKIDELTKQNSELVLESGNFNRLAMLTGRWTVRERKGFSSVLNLSQSTWRWNKGTVDKQCLLG